jgi:hypothetical protein
MTLSFFTLTQCFWLAFLAYWLIAARNSKQEVYR